MMTSGIVTSCVPGELEAAINKFSIAFGISSDFLANRLDTSPLTVSSTS